MSPRTFYRKYIRPLKGKELREIEFPYRVYEKEIRIEKTLLPNDWRLYYWKGKHIPCKSELEAKYLHIWLKHGLHNIEIPKDEKYLAEILPILEKVEKRVYEVAEERLAGYREKTQKDIISSLWLEVHDEEPAYEATTKRK